MVCTLLPAMKHFLSYLHTRYFELMIIYELTVTRDIRMCSHSCQTSKLPNGSRSYFSTFWVEGLAFFGILTFFYRDPRGVSAEKGQTAKLIFPLFNH